MPCSCVPQKDTFQERIDFTLLKAIDADPERYRQNIARRGLPDIDIEKIVELAKIRKGLASQLNGMNGQRKRFTGSNEESIQLKQDLSSVRPRLNDVDEELYEVLNQIPK